MLALYTKMCNEALMPSWHGRLLIAITENIQGMFFGFII